MSGLLSTPKKAMQEAADALRDSIADGKCKDFAEYRQMVGERRGLVKALEILQQRNDDPED